MIERLNSENTPSTVLGAIGSRVVYHRPQRKQRSRTDGPDADSRAAESARGLACGGISVNLVARVSISADGRCACNARERMWTILVILIGLIPATIAKSKGYSFAGWWLYGSALFIVALPHALIMRPSLEVIERRQAASGFRKCQFCAEMIRPEAIVCRFCGRDLPEPVAPTAAPPAPSTLGNKILLLLLSLAD
jgi:hypothetical protein